MDQIVHCSHCHIDMQEVKIPTPNIGCISVYTCPKCGRTEPKRDKPIIVKY
ncbi:MAG: hypothetical protein OH319_02660 [Candidatus Parvarchaeota archaeon]|nr:hypothetical protein [Candidatus Jingweiarchaeum tengchongense]MCW1298270.1 hypothetical protein [Candidatus Jingweiarchaeum tengchongense]MCW1300361.1 hypothetical protein [Candidatus Jingweiarchaeum tengchongense]MCW1304794.1 hypothetical protein [Candidatus Jingweiarchaeum tengchongense]MCW1305384.1 hypothetical protein [Candidatus Jingweiarchaeum tengchongense]